MNAQQKVYQSVVERGYAEGWTLDQFAARQVAKLTEESGELSEAFYITAPRQAEDYVPHAWYIQQAIAAKSAKGSFDTRWHWNHCAVRDLDKAKKELADVLVVVFTLAQALDELDGPFDVVEEAVRKSGADVERGVR